MNMLERNPDKLGTYTDHGFYSGATPDQVRAIFRRMKMPVKILSVREYREMVGKRKRAVESTIRGD